MTDTSPSRPAVASASGATGAPASLQREGLAMTIGLGWFGLSIYAYQAVVGRAVGPAAFADFAIFWGIVNGFGVGSYSPFEQELTRLVAEGRTAGHLGGAVTRTALRLAGLLLVALTLVTLALVPLFTPSGELSRMVGLALTCAAGYAGLSVTYVVRGALSGRRQVLRYAGQLVLDGTVRVALAVLLWLLAVHSPWWYAAMFGVALAVAVAVTGRGVWNRAPHEPDYPLSRFFASLLPVMVASLAGLLVMNFGPVTVRLFTGVADQVRVGQFLAAATLARAPLLAFSAVQVLLLPRLVEAATEGDRRRFVTVIGWALAAVGAITVAAVAGAGTVGPWLLRLVMGSAFRIGAVDLALLVLSVCGFMVCLLLQPAALAARRHWPAARAWVVGTAVFAATLLLPLPALRRVEVALVTSAMVTAVGLGVALWRGLPAAQPGGAAPV